MRKSALFISLLLVQLYVNAQILSESKPVIITHNSAAQRIAPVILPQPDLARLQKEDELNDRFKDQAWRFGENFTVNLSPANSGSWYNENGKAVWELDIKTDNALTLNYFFSEFNLPPSARLFIIDKFSGEYFGAISSQNNSELNNLSTWPFKGSCHTLQLVVDPKEKGDIQLQLAQITHGYRDYKSVDGLGNSGSCNVNAICPESGQWVSQKNSAIMMVSGGNGVCSATLINNTLNNGIPYVLTANHCLKNLSTFTFRFNFQSTNCDSNEYTAVAQTISGAKIRAQNELSDFALLEMATRPPAIYGACYAGWDHSDNVPSSQFVFHHPNGDLKKYSENKNQAIPQKYDDKPASEEVWKVDQWEVGTTEPGSSGSGLYDQNGRIIGQLLGGTSSCTKLMNPDFFGRLAISFAERNNDSTKTLQYWLDPGMSGVLTAEGMCSGTPKASTDFAITQLSGVAQRVCDSAVSPSIVLQNLGLNTITSAIITLKIDGAQISSMNWSGSLVSGANEVVNFPTISLIDGDHTIYIEVSNPNGQADETPLNNISNRNFRISSDGLVHTVQVITDAFADENLWKIFDDKNQLVAADGPFPRGKPGLIFNTKVCLDPGCYRMEFTDGYGDGMCCVDGEGSYLFIENSGDTLVSGWKTPPGPENVPITEKTNFCIDGVGITEINGVEFNLYPNPASSQITVSFKSNEKFSFELIDLTGKILQNGTLSASQATINVQGLSNGFYFLKIRNENTAGTIKLEVLR